jgi:hypothetical protein
MSFFHTALKRCAPALAALAMSPALMASDCTPEKAESQLESLSDAVDTRIQRESGPVRLQKDKVGLVLVARPAPTPPNLVPLVNEFNALTDMMDASPEKVCSNVERIRQKYRI